MDARNGASVGANKIHISFLGAMNAGKSSLVNAVTSQDMSVVSSAPGTTTDPVKKSMELLPLGPVLLIDTPGYDDTGELGSLRVQKTMDAIRQSDAAVLVLDATVGVRECDKKAAALLKEKAIPFVVAWNKADIGAPSDSGASGKAAVFGLETPAVFVSAKTGLNIEELKEKIALVAKSSDNKKEFIGGLVKPGDTVILVIPTDESAPKDRIILPQQMAVRSVIDKGALAISCNPQTLKAALDSMKKAPDLVITDSQAFSSVAKILPKETPLTSFSILMADYKGTLRAEVDAVQKIKGLKDNDLVLISEGCSHRRQCADIGTVKLPAALKKFTGKDLRFEWTSGQGFPRDLSPYALAIHCGACMLNAREMQGRLALAKESGLPMTNYGMALALCSGLLERSLAVFAAIDQNGSLR
ncbi:MAG: [FeFe] hydrogenase H-cluster maturation GTPase HydF [Treponema sp.]|nr:[FeFe] hydrogenase H-cluster maturation GTPase HydF [Treponema sp.]MEE3434440.1 [FeFe] hydrogenase H-cluster maturation GTPase HydF [Treponema sp.]